MNNKTKTLLLLPLVLLLLCVIAAKSIPFKHSLSETESQILDFVSSDLKIHDKTKTRKVKHMKGPFNFTTAPKHIPKAKVSYIDYNENILSLIVVGDSDRMAIINGQVVKEGDSLKGMKIQKIEPKRVLVKNKTAKWLYLEKTQ